jgi:hypothetical protein
MTPLQLHDLFRADVVDTATPYLWSELEVWDYLDDAFHMFARLTDGISDNTSTMTSISVVAATATAVLDPRILKIRRAVLASTGRPLKILNVEDTPVQALNDYGALPPVGYDYLPGVVTSMVIGEQKGQCRWVQVPVVADTVNLTVYRLPLAPVTADSADSALDEIDYWHHRHLLMWMKYRAYGKQDADTYNKGKSADYRVMFEAYCMQAKAEQERQKAKPRFTGYGGL